MVIGIKLILISSLAESNAVYYFSECFEESRRLRLDSPSVPRSASHGRRRSTSNWEYIGQQMDAVTEFHSNIYKSFISSIVQSLEKRFESDGFPTACKVENVLLGEYSGENIIIIQDLYRTDIVSSRILSELDTFHQYAKSIQKTLNNINDVKILLLKERSIAAWCPQIAFLLRILLTMPVTSVECVRNFSALNRLKSVLRTTMGHDRMSSLMIGHIHKEIIDTIPVDVLMKKFIKANKQRELTFAVPGT